MNHDTRTSPDDDARAEREARVLAVVLGVTSDEEKTAVEHLLGDDPELRAYHSELLAILPEVTASLKNTTDVPDLRMDEARRAVLLQKLRGMKNTVRRAGDGAEVTTPTDKKNPASNIIPWPVFLRKNVGVLAACATFVVGGIFLATGDYSHVQKAAWIDPPPAEAEPFIAKAGSGFLGVVEAQRDFDADSSVPLVVAEPLHSVEISDIVEDFGSKDFAPRKPQTEARPSRIRGWTDGSSDPYAIVLPSSKMDSDELQRSVKQRESPALTSPAEFGATGRSSPGKLELLKNEKNYSEATVVDVGQIVTASPSPNSFSDSKKAAPIPGNQVTHSQPMRSGVRVPESSSPAANRLGAISGSGELEATSKISAPPSTPRPVLVVPAFKDTVGSSRSAGTKPSPPRPASSTMPVLGEGKGIGVGRGGGRGSFEGRESENIHRGDEHAPVTRQSGKQVADEEIQAQITRGRAQYLYGDYEGARDTFKGVLQSQSNHAEAKAHFDRMEKVISNPAMRRQLSGKVHLDDVDTAWRLPDEVVKKLQSPPPPPVTLADTLASENAFSTFSLNVSDVAFRLAGDALSQGRWPERASLRTEEFVNAVKYNDPAPAQNEAVTLTQEQARHPFAHNRDLLRLSVQTASDGRNARQPLNVTVLLDTSGSMTRADRQEIVAVALEALAENLRPHDTVSVIGFARHPRLLVDGSNGSDGSKKLRALIGRIPPEGGTNLELALQAAYEKNRATQKSGAQNMVVLLTDGAANLGDANPESLAKIISQNKKRGIGLNCYGIGFDGYNDAMLETLARTSNGRYAYLNNAAEARGDFAAKLAGALQVAAQNVKVQVEFNPERVGAYRLMGYEKHRLKKEDFRDNTVTAAELGAAESGTAIYSVEVKPDGIGDIGVVRVRYQNPQTGDYAEREWNIPYSPSVPAFEDAAAGVQLAATAALFAEKLEGSAQAQTVSLRELNRVLKKANASLGVSPENRKLQTMIEAAIRLE